MPEIDPATAFLWFAAFLFSTTVHEAMHAWAAYRGGDPTAYHGGQVSLSPLPHVAREPIGMLVIPLLTAFTQGWAIGWASPPYDPQWPARYPKRAALMAAAGPAGNLAIAILAFVALRAGLSAGWLRSPETVNFDHLVETANAARTLPGEALSVLLVLNVFLFVFNLLPLPPLDGASVVTLVLPAAAAESLNEWSGMPAFRLIGLVVAWQVFPLFTDPLFLLILRLVHPAESYS